ncbi:hypothetical protein PsorP6_012023 [Peronosclerospora sorghi]|uniref:Uncharacterized protein n=1 Tax=Peronosclerospora sorghi TaxID=230839 RepID=A0ACC0WI63_9STRA|nr:hypothetical protein PsorP6_012023 [Peronosclerospora sorghi]
MVVDDGVEPVTPFEAVKGETSHHVNSRQTISRSSIAAKVGVSSSNLQEANDIKNGAMLESPELSETFFPSHHWNVTEVPLI